MKEGGDVNAYGKIDSDYGDDCAKVKPIYIAVMRCNVEAAKWLVHEAGATTDHLPVEEDAAEVEWEVYHSDDKYPMYQFLRENGMIPPAEHALEQKYILCTEAPKLTGLTFKCKYFELGFRSAWQAVSFKTDCKHDFIDNRWFEVGGFDYGKEE